MKIVGVDISQESYSVEVEVYEYPFGLLTLSPQGALDLLQNLEQSCEQLQDLAGHYYACHECGQTHHNSVTICPSLEGDEQ